VGSTTLGGPPTPGPYGLYLNPPELEEEKELAGGVGPEEEERLGGVGPEEEELWPEAEL